MPTPSFEAALQGKAPGVQVIQGSGMAGSGSVIRIRGIASVSAGADPLYVIDGIPITQDPFLRGNNGAMNSNPLATINPNDIESVEILKDAAAAGIYGSRGANGVILITTKRGKEGKATFEFGTRFGTSQPTAKANMMNSAEYLQIRKEAWENDGNVGLPTNLPGGLTWAEAQQNDTDWWDAVTQTGIKHQYDFSVKKGGKKMAAYAGFSFNHNESFLKNNSYERLSGRVNLDYNPIEELSIKLSTSLSRGVNNRVEAAWSGGLGAAMSTALPIYPIYNEDGSFFIDAGTGNNPLMRAENIDWQAVELRTVNSLNLTYKPLKGLEITASGNYDYMDIDDTLIEGSALDLVNGNEFDKRNFVNVNNYSTSLVSQYSFSSNNTHNFKVLLGTEYQYSEASSSYQEFINGEENAAAANTNPIDDWKFFSVFGRVNYNYKQKYLFEAVFRQDGSSKFGPNNRYGIFPAFSVAWNISDEDFLKSSNVISLLKLKASYGITGNANFPNNRWRGVYLPADGNITYNNSPIIAPTVLENPDLKWETATNFNVTIEAGFAKDRFAIEASYYNRDTKDVLMEISVPPSSGFSNQWANAGSILNRGYELALTSRNMVKAFKWTTTFNISYNYNEVKSLGGYSEDAVGGGTNDTRILVGYPIGVNYLVPYAGVDPESGAPLYLNKNGDITTTWSPDDRRVVGDVLPDFVGGFNNTFSYKGFDLGVFFTFVSGGDIYDSSSKRQLGVVTDWNMRTDFFGRWRQPGDAEASYPRATLETAGYGSGTPWINTDLWLHDGSFVRLRNLSLSYNLPSVFVEKLKLNSARISFSATNLLTFTRFPGLDPEIARDFENPTDRNLSPNITFLTPPQERTFNLGLNISF